MNGYQAIVGNCFSDHIPKDRAVLIIDTKECSKASTVRSVVLVASAHHIHAYKEKVIIGDETRSFEVVHFIEERLIRVSC